jgi:hypothetical protein
MQSFEDSFFVAINYSKSNNEKNDYLEMLAFPTFFSRMFRISIIERDF